MTGEQALKLARECLRAHSIGPAGVYGEAADMLEHIHRMLSRFCEAHEYFEDLCEVHDEARNTLEEDYQ